MSKPFPDRKVMLVTGASSGFGELAARKLLALGHTVYAAARRVVPMAGLEKLGAKVLEMDVTDNGTVISGVERIVEEQGRVDVVFANAGYGSYGIVEAVSMDEILYQFDVNVFGVARTIKAVLPRMRRQGSGRIIITASLVSYLAIPCAGWYASSKHAVKGMADALRQEVRGMGIEVVMIEPGIVKTGFDRVALGNLDRAGQHADYDRLVKGIKRGLLKSYANGPGPERTVRAMVRAATVKKPKTRYRTTFDAWLGTKARVLFGDRCLDSLLISMFNKDTETCR